MKNEVKYFEREPFNASNNAKSDEVVLEAIKKIKSNNIFDKYYAPFTKLNTIQKAVQILIILMSKLIPFLLLMNG